MKKFIRWVIIIVAFLFALAIRSVAKEIVAPSALSGAIIGILFIGFILGVWKLTEKLEKTTK